MRYSDARSKFTIAVLACIFLTAPKVQAQGLEAQSVPTQYVATVWRTEQGLPQNSVNAMVQDHQGYLWIGTFGALARFDGDRFTIFTSAHTAGFASARIRSLYESRSGELWVGTVDGGLIWLHNGAAITYTERDGLPGGIINSIREDVSGQMWINTSRGVAHFVGTKLEAYLFHRGKPVSEFYLQARDGSMWFHSGTDVIRFGADGSIATLNVRKPGSFLLRETRDGSVWIGWPEPQYRLVRYYKGLFSDAQLPNIKEGKLLPDSPQLLMAKDNDGELLLLTPAGLVRIVDGKLSPPEALPWPANGGDLPKVRRLMVDREGNRWVGTIGSGLLRFRRTPLTAYGSEEGLANSSFSALFKEREGRFWMGGDSLYWFDGGQFHLFPGIANIRAISQTREGDMWFGGYGGLYRWNSGVLTHFNVEAPAVRTIYQDEQGTIWVGAITEDHPGGLYRFSSGKLEQIPGISDVRKIIEDRNGDLWVGGLEGLWRLHDGKTELYNQKQGLSSNAVYDIYQDSTGTLWLATYGGGLNRFRDGRFKAITTREGLPNDMLLYILEDDNRNLWLSSNQNIFRFSLSELNDFADGKISSILPVSYGVAEGMRSSECNGGSPAGWRTSDGRLWFPTLRGVVAIDPNAGSRLPPPVLVEEALAGELRLARDSQTSIPHANNTLDFRFTALSFSAPENLRFKYRLDPFDKDWVDAGTRRAAHYTNMPPGKYTFQVTAANSYGIWSESAARLDFRVLPAYYETTWFRALCLGALLAMLWMLYRLRLRQVAHQFNMTLDARVGERTRIARELHDTLLQSFHGLLMSFQTASRLLPGRPTEAKQKLDGAIEQAEDAILEGRDAVQGLRASTLQSNDLARAISALGEELATDSTNNAPSPKFNVAVEGVPRDLHPIPRDEVYKIAAEALRNAFRHAQARQIEVEIHYDDQDFRLHVRDDGRGFDPAVPASLGREDHYGLPGMRERAKIAGGKLTVWSEVNAGTEVELEIPAGTAYAKTPRRSWLSEKLAGKAQEMK
jgi:signal transduction histidine kinase/ligand-binding sensor domain-containing protein